MHSGIYPILKFNEIIEEDQGHAPSTHTITYAQCSKASSPSVFGSRRYGRQYLKGPPGRTGEDYGYDSSVTDPSRTIETYSHPLDGSLS